MTWAWLRDVLQAAVYLGPTALVSFGAALIGAAFGVLIPTFARRWL